MASISFTIDCLSSFVFPEFPFNVVGNGQQFVHSDPDASVFNPVSAVRATSWQDRGVTCLTVVSRVSHSELSTAIILHHLSVKSHRKRNELADNQVMSERPAAHIQCRRLSSAFIGAFCCVWNLLLSTSLSVCNGAVSGLGRKLYCNFKMHFMTIVSMRKFE